MYECMNPMLVKQTSDHKSIFYSIFVRHALSLYPGSLVDSRAFLQLQAHSLQGSFEECGCSGVGVLSLRLPSADGGSLAALSLVVCDRVLKPLHQPVERYCRLGE